jgi:hypothetical protein
MKTIEPRKVEIKVERPNGELETIIHPKIDWMNDKIFAQMNKAMKNAGRGVCLNYRNIDAVVEMEESDYQGRCERCTEKLDTRKAYGQMEWTRFGGKKVRVMAHYCDSCRRVLAAVGQGEITELQQRAAEVPSIERAYKGEGEE